MIEKKQYRSVNHQRILYGLWGFLLSVFLISSPSFSCCFLYQYSYILSSNQGNILVLPETSFYWNLRLIVGKPFSEPPYYPKNESRPFEPSTIQYFSVENFAHLSETNPWTGTLDADCSDLEQCLSKQQITDVSKAEFLQKYRHLREIIRDDSLPNLSDIMDSSYRPNVPSPYFSGEYDTLIQQLPKEFKLYADGSAKYYAEQVDGATESWMQVLALPKEERHYRTTWAAFMIAKTLMDRDPTTALSFFQQTEEAIKEGFADSLHCADELIGWQARAEMNAGKYKESIHHYYDLFIKGQENQSVSLREVCQRFHKDPYLDKRILHDTLCRRILSAYPSDKRWIKALHEEKISFEQAELDRLIWQAYQSQEYNTAKEWLALQQPQTTVGQWILSKLLLREGKVNEAVSILHSLVGKFPTRFSEDEASAELGVLKLGQKQFVEAMDFFLKSGYYADMAYIADRVLTTTELEHYLIRHKKARYLYEPIKCYSETEKIIFPSEQDYYSYLSNILARKYLREDNFDKAKRWMSEMQFAFDGYYNGLQAGDNPKLKNNERAEGYYSAACNLQHSGMELMGTEVFPDWRMVNGQIDIYKNFLVNRTNKKLHDPGQIVPAILKPYLLASDNEIKRISQNAPKPDKRFHYRYIASDLLWKAAKLLPDNDERTARMLYEGGTYMKNRDPLTADKFYKTLVRRCGNLPIGKKANAERWFPESFNVKEATAEVAEPTELIIK